jgi:hypothetical protein
MKDIFIGGRNDILDGENDTLDGESRCGYSRYNMNIFCFMANTGIEEDDEEDED